MKTAIYTTTKTEMDEKIWDSMTEQEKQEYIEQFKNLF